MSDGGEGAWRTGYYQGKKDEQERIVNLLRSEGWLSPHGTTGLTDALLNFIVGHGDDLTAGDVASFADEVITLIEGEQ